MSLLRRSGIRSALVATLAVGALVWAGQQAGPGAMDLAAVQENGCSVTTGNGRVVTQPAANCPIDIELGNVLTTSLGAADTMAPGDTATRPVDVSNVGNTAFQSLTLTSQPSGALSGSLRLTISRCSLAWVAGASGWTCSGTASTLLAAGSAANDEFPIADSPAMSRDGVDHLLIGITLDASAGNDLQGETSTMTYTFTATRNPGKNK